MDYRHYYDKDLSWRDQKKAKVVAKYLRKTCSSLCKHEHDHIGNTRSKSSNDVASIKQEIEEIQKE